MTYLCYILVVCMCMPVFGCIHGSADTSGAYESHIFLEVELHWLLAVRCVC